MQEDTRIQRMVLIPSFTGLRLVQIQKQIQKQIQGLNPFFYRSSVGRYGQPD